MGITCYFPESCQVVQKAWFQPLPTEPGAVESRYQQASRTQGPTAMPSSHSPHWAPPITWTITGASGPEMGSRCSGSHRHHIHPERAVSPLSPHQGGNTEAEVWRAAFSRRSTCNTLGKPEYSSTKLSFAVCGQVLPGLASLSPRLQVSPTQKAACASRARPDWAGVCCPRHGRGMDTHLFRS